MPVKLWVIPASDAYRHFICPSGGMYHRPGQTVNAGVPIPQTCPMYVLS